MENISVGRTIARARHRKRLTQRQLAEVLGVAVSTVANWETDQHFPLRYLGAVEEALDISLAEYEPQATS
jgi:transcriptional regulator with XRE-family HTH domain